MDMIKVWTHNPAEVEKDILEGKETEEIMTEYGANEFAVDFLKKTNIWEHLLIKPERGKENGYDWKKLGGIAILLELLHTGKLSMANKILNDAKLMVELGFTFEEVQSKKGKGIIHRDTVRNYFKAIPVDESIKGFYEYLSFFRGKRWNRGMSHAADGFEIEVEGETYEGAGEVYDEREKRWKRGYKLVILMNVEEERERIVGFALGPINMDERKLLLKIFEDLEKHVGKAKDIVSEVILDRGYWGYDFLEKTLVEKYGIDYVIIAKKNFTFVKDDLRHLIDTNQIEFQDRKLFNRTTQEWEDVKVAYVKNVWHGYVSKDQPYQGMVNVVILKKKVIKNGKEEEKEIFYVTNKRVVKDPLKIVKLYGSRWCIENQGFRDLSQRWLIGTPIGRSLNAITARICLVLKLYNAVKVMEMKFGKEWEKNRQEIRSWGEDSFIGGHAIIVYSGEHFGTFSTDHFKVLIEKKTKKETTLILLKQAKKYISQDDYEKLKQELSG